jgi:acetyl esterase/lipase
MPKAIVSTYGFHDLLDVHRIAREKKIAGWARRMIVEAAHSYVGPHVDDAVRAAPLSSPLTVLASDLPLARPLPPIFIDAGTKDPLMPHSRRLAAVLGKRGVPHEFHLAVGEIHGYDAMFWRRAAQNKWQRVGQFLRRHMGVAAAANGERREARAS